MIDKTTLAGRVSALLSRAILCGAVAALITVQSGNAYAQGVSACHDRGGVWRNGQCERDTGPGVFDLFGLVVVAALGLTAAGVFGAANAKKSPAASPPRQQRR